MKSRENVLQIKKYTLKNTLKQSTSKLSTICLLPSSNPFWIHNLKSKFSCKTLKFIICITNFNEIWSYGLFHSFYDYNFNGKNIRREVNTKCLYSKRKCYYITRKYWFPEKLPTAIMHITCINIFSFFSHHELYNTYEIKT